MPQPMTPEETERFIRTMVPEVVRTVSEGRTYRISAYTEELQAAFREVTARAAEHLARPLMGYGNGREFWISVPETGQNAAAVTSRP